MSLDLSFNNWYSYFPSTRLCGGMSADQLATVIAFGHKPALFARLDHETWERVPRRLTRDFDYDPETGTAFNATLPQDSPARTCALVPSDRGDWPALREARRVLEFLGIVGVWFPDMGQDALGNSYRQLPSINECGAVICAANWLESKSLFTHLASMLGNPFVAVPTRCAIDEDGSGALENALQSQARGVVAVGLDNGFGAACAVWRMFGALRKADAATPASE
jgi:NCAIR mutase (PurE)-related protein